MRGFWDLNNAHIEKESKVAFHNKIQIKYASVGIKIW